MSTKEFYILCPSGIKVCLDVREEDSLSQVRQQILEDLEEYILDDEGRGLITENFAFDVGGVRILRKQEEKKMTWNLLHKEIKIRPVQWSKKRCITQDETGPHSKPVKKIKSEDLNSDSPSKLTVNPPTDSVVPIKNAEWSMGSLKQSSLKDIPMECDQCEDDNSNVQIDYIKEENILHPEDFEKDGETVNSRADESDEEANEMVSASNNNKDVDHTSKLNDKATYAVDTSQSALACMRSLLVANPLFCSSERHTEWMKEIDAAQLSPIPNITIGVLGNTGVGKSSLLNALLDEASILPTSGSRGCTAAVVELRYNSELAKLNSISDEVYVYQGDVEFIKHEEWLKELKILVDECSTKAGIIDVAPPDPKRHFEAAAAWAKIEQVYGYGSMSLFSGNSINYTFSVLAHNSRVNSFLKSKSGSPNQNNVICINEGSVTPGSPDATELLSSFAKMRLRMLKEKWASDFRDKINNYVYRKGNGSEPQTWPLIRKAVLRGPWPVLSTQCCLVDLPGLRDANAARAQVSEQYLKNCDQIWVVAPIKRAVDDGTAKELFGEQFKRRLLMDGQYGNVSFICTQTDDCEATEIMHDHADVAKQESGRWEKMQAISEKISKLENKLQEHDVLEAKYKDAYYQFKKEEKDLRRNKKKKDASIDVLSILNDNFVIAKAQKEDCYKKLHEWEKRNQTTLDSLPIECEVEQKKLKALCANVRNQYSTKCLQADFRAGLKDLCGKEVGDEDDEDSDDEDSDDEDYDEDSDDHDDGNEDKHEYSKMALPSDFVMDVFTVSSNDYLKIQGIKSKSDGPPNTFARVDDTQIPRLRRFVHETTARYRTAFAKKTVHHASDILDKIKLVCMSASDSPSGQMSLQCREIFNEEISNIKKYIDSLADKFRDKISATVQLNLVPSLRRGAQKAVDSAIPLVESWGSKSRRSSDFHDLDHNGLHFSTYRATVKRGGVFTSGSAGEIDMNQDLCDPMEEEYTLDWLKTFGSALGLEIDVVKKGIKKNCESVNNKLVCLFEQQGMDKFQLSSVSNTANRCCLTNVQTIFDAMREFGRETQRDLSRSLVSTIENSMHSSYQACLNCEGGQGLYNRMKLAMRTTTSDKVHIMFDQSRDNIIKGIDDLVKQLVQLLSKTKDKIQTNLEAIYSIYWDDQRANKVINPVIQEKSRTCRVSFIPELNNIASKLKTAQESVGIEREGKELDMIAVDPIDTTNECKMNEAEDRGENDDLCESNEKTGNIIVSCHLPNPNDEKQERICAT